MSTMDPDTTPGMQPPDGQTSHFHAPWNSLQIGTFIAFGITYFLATVFLGLRYYQAFKLIKEIEVDLVIITIAYGVSVTYFWTMVRSLTKIAILSVLYRINPSVTYRYFVVTVAIAIFIYTLALCIITGAPCNPLKSGTTNPTHPHDPQSPFFTETESHGRLPPGSGIGCHHLLNSPPTIRHPPRQDARHNLYRSHPGRVVIVEINLAIICPCAMRFKRPVATYLPGLSLFSSRSHSAAGKTTYSSSVNRFRLDHSQHSYQLHSVQKGNTGPFSDSNGISIHRSFKVDVKGTDRHTGDGESADKILA
ncbi:hypothetical protein MAP00_004393 [Monascus purpureus]|nr:hypothetical protein MAP00_004393 [Monascus purpureus]